MVRSLTKVQIVHIDDFDTLLTVCTQFIDRESILESDTTVTVIDG